MILLICFEEIDIIEKIKEGISNILDLSVRVYPKQPGVRARKRIRFNLQYNAEDFIPKINEILLKEKANYGLGLTYRDLWVPGLNFVFGLASPIHKSCIISLVRLKNPDKELYIKRGVKEAVHELGHLFGLQHCEDSRCVMHFSNCLEDTDCKKKTFCDKCKKSFKNLPGLL